MLASLYEENHVKCYATEILGFLGILRSGSYEHGICMRGLGDLVDLVVSSIDSRLAVKDSASPLICTTEKFQLTAGISSHILHKIL